MATIFNTKKAACSCRAPIKSPDGESFTQYDLQKRPLGVGCCYSVDLDVVYDQMVEYTDENTPCEQCVKRGQHALSIECFQDEEGNCTDCTASYEDAGLWEALASSSPHGRVSTYEIPQCSKIVILKGVTDIASGVYESVSIFKGRKRGSNPAFLYNSFEDPARLDCNASPICDTDSLRKCCTSTIPASPPSQPQPRNITRAYFEYRTCTVASDVSPLEPTFANCVSCDEDYPPTIDWYSNLVLPCAIDIDIPANEWNPEYKYREYMMGYQKEASWWFVDEELPSMYADLADNDPYGGRKHNIVIHFEVNSKSITCCNMTCPGRPEPGSIGCPPEEGFSFPPCEYGNNSKAGFCGGLDPYPGAHNRRYITDKDLRERSTKIYAVAGYYNGCGRDDLQAICDKHFGDE